MPYPKEWDSNPAYDLHIENYKRSHPHEYPSHEINEQTKLLKEILHQAKEQTFILREIYKRTTPTPIVISFKEITMNPEGPGVTQVWTGTISPAGATFPSGTTFTAVPSDPTVTATLDSTGLILTIAYPTTFVANPTAPFSVAYSTSTFVPSPSTAPASITETITPTVPVVALTPTSVGFVQTQ